MHFIDYGIRKSTVCLWLIYEISSGHAEYFNLFIFSVMWVLSYIKAWKDVYNLKLCSIKYILIKSTYYKLEILIGFVSWLPHRKFVCCLSSSNAKDFCCLAPFGAGRLIW